MTPSSNPLPVNDGDTPNVSTESVSDDIETAGSRVAANSLLLRSIMGHLDSKSNLVKCMLLCKEQFELAARMLYQSSRRNSFSRLWDQGCTMERLRIYTDGVRALNIDGSRLDASLVIRLLNQYGALDEIHSTLIVKGLHVTELYSYEDRQVLVRGSQPISDILDDNLVVDTLHGLVYIETRSIGSKGQHLNEEEGKLILDGIVNKIGTSEGGRTWLVDLQQLELPSVTFNLKSLETVLIGCPHLGVLRCSLDTRGMSIDQTEAYHEDLRQFFEKKGATIKELDVRHIGGGTMGWLQTLVGAPILRLSGTMDGIAPDFLEHVVTREPKSHRERLTRQLILSLRDVTIKEVNPYEAAKSLRWLISPFCEVYVEAPEDGTPAAWQPKVESWVEQFRSILKTLQREDDIKRKTSMSKGWKEMQKVPDGGDAREASGSGTVEARPDGGDVKTAPGGGESAPTNGGVDSTVGGGDEPSL